jgi:hypothetical protein
MFLSGVVEAPGDLLQLSLVLLQNTQHTLEWALRPEKMLIANTRARKTVTRKRVRHI